MSRSKDDIDRLLGEWRRVAATARPPETGLVAGMRARAAMPASLVGVMAIAVVLVVVLSSRGPAGGAGASPAVPGTPPASSGASLPSSSVPATPVPVTPVPSGLVLRNEGTATDGRFTISLAVARTEYVAGEDILPTASVVFEGPGSTVTVGHGRSAVVFSVREVGGTREVAGGTDAICLTSTWPRGEPQSFPWQRSGGYSTDDQTANDRFAQAYLENGPPDGLRLPAGTWELAAALEVSVGECGPTTPLTARVRIRVDDAVAGAPTPSGSPALAHLGPVVRCIRLEAGDCEGAAALAQDLWPEAYAAAELVLVAQSPPPSCPDDAACVQAPAFRFDALVAMLPRAGVAMGQTVLVTGAGGPEIAEPTETAAMLTDELTTLAEQGLVDAGGGTRFPILVGLPADPGAVVSCPLARVSGTLVEDPRTGLGLARPDGAILRVRWPFGWSGRRDGAGTALVDSTGTPLARAGDPIEAAGQPLTGGVADALVCQLGTP